MNCVLTQPGSFPEVFIGTETLPLWPSITDIPTNLMPLASAVVPCYNTHTSRVGLTPSPTCQPGKVVSRKGDVAKDGN